MTSINKSGIPAKKRSDYPATKTDIERLWPVLVQERKEMLAYRQRVREAMRAAGQGRAQG